MINFKSLIKINWQRIYDGLLDFVQKTCHYYMLRFRLSRLIHQTSSLRIKSGLLIVNTETMRDQLRHLSRNERKTILGAWRVLTYQLEKLHEECFLPSSEFANNLKRLLSKKDQEVDPLKDRPLRMMTYFDTKERRCARR